MDVVLGVVVIGQGGGSGFGGGGIFCGPLVVLI